MAPLELWLRLRLLLRRQSFFFFLSYFQVQIQLLDYFPNGSFHDEKFRSQDTMSEFITNMTVVTEVSLIVSQIQGEQVISDPLHIV